jgi:hypothetical protein
MLKIVIAGLTGLAIAGGGIALAQSGPRSDAPRWQPSAEDIAALVDARVAALKAGLRLTAEQEKHWPQVEAAIRALAKERTERMAQRRAAREARAAGRDASTDLVERLRQRADAMATRAAALKQLAEAADPLYKSLDDSQKRRLGLMLRRVDGAGLAPRRGEGPRFGGHRFGDGGHHGRRGG